MSIQAKKISNGLIENVTALKTFRTSQNIIALNSQWIKTKKLILMSTYYHRRHYMVTGNPSFFFHCYILQYVFLLNFFCWLAYISFVHPFCLYQDVIRSTIINHRFGYLLLLDSQSRLTNSNTFTHLISLKKARCNSTLDKTGKGNLPTILILCRINCNFQSNAISTFRWIEIHGR